MALERALPLNVDIPLLAEIAFLPQWSASQIARRALAVLLAAAIFSLPILLFLPFLTTPFMRDEAFYASVAQVMRHGEMPYAYGFDNKPPMIFYWYYLSFQVFGENVWAPRLLAALLLSATAGMVYVQARMFFTHKWGLVAAFLFALSTGIAKFETNANTEYFLVFFAVMALLAFTLGQQRGGWYWYALCGAASVAAILTKQTAAFFPVVFLAFLLVPLLRQRSAEVVRQLLASSGYLAAGGLAAFVAILSPFAMTGTLNEFWQSAVVYAGQYTEQVSLGQKIEAMYESAPRQLLNTAGPWTLLAAGGILCVILRPSRERLLLLAWLAAAGAGVAAAGRFYPHYYVTLLPGMALLAVPALQWLKANWQDRRVAVGAVAAFVVISVSPLMTNAQIYFQPNTDERHIAKYGDNPMTAWEIDSEDLGSWIAGITRPGEKIYQFGFMPGIYFHAHRESPTQYTFKHPFAIDEAYAEEAVRDFEADMPVLIFDSAAYERDGAFTYHGKTITDFMHEHYVYAGKYFFGDLWLLEGWQPARPIGSSAVVMDAYSSQPAPARSSP